MIPPCLCRQRKDKNFPSPLPSPFFPNHPPPHCLPSVLALIDLVRSATSLDPFLFQPQRKESFSSLLPFNWSMPSWPRWRAHLPIFSSFILPEPPNTVENFTPGAYRNFFFSFSSLGFTLLPLPFSLFLKRMPNSDLGHP